MAEYINQFFERWVCCATVDYDDVLDAVRAVRINPDCLAEECVGYTHDPVQRHLTSVPEEIVIADNQFDEVRSVDNLEKIPFSVVCNDLSPLVLDTKDALGLYLDMPTSEVDDVTVADVATDSAIDIMAAEVIVNSGMKKPSLVFKNCQDVVEVKRHRRLPHQRRGDYVACVVSEVKNRMGCPKPTAANQLAVRRMVHNICGQHCIRATHERGVIEVIVAGVFTPDEHDLLGARMLGSNAVHDLVEEITDPKPKNVWQQWVGRFTGRRGARRLRSGE